MRAIHIRVSYGDVLAMVSALHYCVKHRAWWPMQDEVRHQRWRRKWGHWRADTIGEHITVYRKIRRLTLRTNNNIGEWRHGRGQT